MLSTRSKAAPQVVEGDGVKGPKGMLWVPGGEFLMGSDHKLAQSFKVHLDGYDLSNALAGKEPSPRRELFAEQKAHGFHVWQQPFVPLRLPKIFNLRSDPFETADHEGMDYERWAVEHLFLTVPAQQYVGQFLATFKEFPPSQKPGSFSIDRALEALEQTGRNR